MERLNMPFVTSIEEALKYPTNTRVSFNCTKCGIFADQRVEQIKNTNRLMCTKCSKDIGRQEFLAKKNSMSPEEYLKSKSFKHINDLAETEGIPGCKFITFNCTKCGVLAGNELIRLRQKGLLLCGDCMKKHTNLERFGYEMPAQRPEAREAASKFNKEHKDEINEARRLAIRDKYGVDNVMQVKEFKDNCFNSNRDNHGGVLAQQTEEQRKSQSERMLAHPEIQIKSTEANKANHGGVHSLALPENREKLYEYQRTHRAETQEIRDINTLKTCGKSDWMRYGTPEFNCLQFTRFLDSYPGALDKDFIKTVLMDNGISETLFGDIEKLKATLFELRESIDWNEMNKARFKAMYNTTHPCSKPIYLDGKEFDSKWELAYYLYERDVNNADIVREPVKIKYKDASGKPHSYSPDFSINGKLVEIKGPQFYKDKNVDNELYCPYESEDSEIQQCFKALGETIKSNDIEVISSDKITKYTDYMVNGYDPTWLRSLYLDNLLRYAFSRFTFMPMYCSAMNNGKGVTPFDIQQSQKYAPITGPGITPFDIKQPTK